MSFFLFSCFCFSLSFCAFGFSLFQWICCWSAHHVCCACVSYPVRWNGISLPTFLATRHIAIVVVVVLTITHRSMQSVVTGQPPITLQRKITSGGKQIKSRRHDNSNKSNTSDKDKRSEISVRTYQDTYHMVSESPPKPKPRRQHSTHKNKTGWKKRCPNRNRKREGREEEIKQNKSTSSTQDRKHGE